MTDMKIPNYEFENLNLVRRMYVSVNLIKPDDQNIVTEKTEEERKKEQDLYNSMTVSNMCIVWESLLVEKKKKNRLAYRKIKNSGKKSKSKNFKFNNNLFDPAIYEAYLVRNCVVHNSGYASKIFLDSTNKYKTIKLGEKIDFNKDIESFFKAFEDSYKKVNKL